MDEPPDEFDVVVVGSLNLDLVVRTERRPGGGETVSGSAYAEHAGGKGLNQAVAAARSGATVAIVGNVGDDDAGRRLRDIVVVEGIDDRWLLTVDDEPTGRALITVDASGENSIVVVAGANSTPIRDALPRGRVVLAQLETSLDAVTTGFGHGRRTGALNVLNPAPAVELPDELIELVDVIVPNEHEVELLGGRASLSRLVDDLVVTLGADGADHVHGEVTERIEPFTLDAGEPVDTTGAGDAFCGSLSARLAAGDRMGAALQWAAAAGALATTVDGAVPSQPSADAVRRLLER